jgi:hypothetical protein
VLELPPSDIYRSPFVEPIGHLAMQAARADQNVYTLCATVPFDGSPLQMHPGETEKRLRNWTDKKAQTFLKTRLELISEAATRNQALQAMNNFERLRLARHRVIHDAVEVGIDLEGKAYALAVEYRKETPDRSGVYLHRVTPDQIATLACEVYELNQDLNQLIARVRDFKPRPEVG